ncbi:hypothetical protein [Bradyrhizobium sp. LA2.1]|uniref:hypothetical protein n=1 Tax=Bradyrhizobium sp. LA2.1 TaxID=3156376 RepID=UPI00339455D8
MYSNISITSLVSPSAAGRGSSAARALLTAAAISIGWTILLCSAFDPRWESNDDVTMSMVAHGYGIASYGSDLLFFSNVLWGSFVRSLPMIDGILGYSIATLLSMTLASGATAYFLLRLGVRPIVAILAVILVFMRPTLLPQFTVTAGLLAVSAVLGLQAYSRHGSVRDLVAACWLTFLAFLIRDLELALVMAVALPLLPWRKLADARPARWAAAGLVICIAGATITDERAYSSPEWQTFRQQNAARAPLTDFGAAKFILDRPELMDRHGVSANDVRMVSGWFFVDPQLSNPDLLRSLIGEIPAKTMVETNLASSLPVVNALPRSPELLALTCVGAFLLMVSLRPGLLFAWLLFYAAILIFAAIGRPPPVRVCFPPLALLTLAPLAMQSRLPQWRGIVLAAAVMAGAIFNGRYLIREADADNRAIELARHQKFSSSDSTFIWGDALPFEAVFPVFTREEEVRSIRFYGLGALTLAPFSVPTADEAANRGFLVRLRSEAGISLIAAPSQQALLNTYCMEHYGTPLRTQITSKGELWTIVNASCAAATE